MSGTQTVLTQQLENLFRETGSAHHKAFIATKGDDAEWPAWYADYLFDKLRSIFSSPFTKSELVYLFVKTEKERQKYSPGSDWPSFYSRAFIEELGA